ncbi:Uncharacterised protein [Vibrio cholerae]|nr:Uncharacterised protein [Vibrio cholerae]
MLFLPVDLYLTLCIGQKHKTGVFNFKTVEQTHHVIHRLRHTRHGIAIHQLVVGKHFDFAIRLLEHADHGRLS